MQGFENSSREGIVGGRVVRLPAAVGQWNGCGEIDIANVVKVAGVVEADGWIQVLVNHPDYDRE
jgi:hypothetical protein